MSLAVATVIGTAVTAVMGFQQQQQAASAMQYQAGLYEQQAQQQAALTQVEIGQQELQRNADEIAQRDEANRARRRARQIEQQAYAAMAARGIMATPSGSFGAILGDAEEELYRDLDSNRVQRGFMAVSNLSQLAGTAGRGAQAITQARLGQSTALADAKTARVNAWTGLATGLTKAYRISESG